MIGGVPAQCEHQCTNALGMPACDMALLHGIAATSMDPLS